MEAEYIVGKTKGGFTVAKFCGGSLPEQVYTLEWSATVGKGIRTLTCTCPAFIYRGGCKHQRMVRESAAVRGVTLEEI